MKQHIHFHENTENCMLTQNLTGIVSFLFAQMLILLKKGKSPIVSSF